MQLFHNDKGVLTPIEKDSFKLEKDIQSLIESNMETLFGLEFVSSEFAIAEFRLDSLAYDEQNNSFVIVEYKKGHSYSVVDQGYSYLSVMLNNKAEFILEYNEKTYKQLKRNDIDWTSSRVIFVSPSFNTYQKNSVNFKDVPFELWEIKKFDGGLVALEQQVSNSNESIENISGSNPNSVIKKVTTEVKVLSEAQLTSGLSEGLSDVWDTFRSQLLELPNTSIHTTQNYVSVKYDGTALIYIRFRKKELSCEIVRGNVYPDGKSRLKFFEIDDPKGVTGVRDWTWKSGVKGSVYTFSIKSLDELDYRMYLVKQKYEYMS
jgi:predicted transport protein